MPLGCEETVNCQTNSRRPPGRGRGGDAAGVRKLAAPHGFQERRIMAKKVTCPLCGAEITGDTDDALVAAADAHGDDNHGMRAPREMILSSATDA